MNRVTALIVAMAMLLAHSLAIHLDPSGHFGQPYDVAHIAFSLARNLVHEGTLNWIPEFSDAQAGGLGSYPSPLWVLISSFAERLYIPVNRYAQIVGILFAILTVRTSVRFDEDRISSVIPALLLVTSGGFAAAGVSGTEYSMFAWLITFAFVSFEHKQRIPFALSLVFLMLTRPEAVFIWLAFGVFAWLERLGPDHVRADATAYWTMVPSGLVMALMFLLQSGDGSSLYGSWVLSILNPDGQRLSQGFGYLRDFMEMSVTPLLVVFPIGALVMKGLSATGKRALSLASLWLLLVTLAGPNLSLWHWFPLYPYWPSPSNRVCSQPWIQNGAGWKGQRGQC